MVAHGQQQGSNRHVDNMAAAFEQPKARISCYVDSLYTFGCDYSMVTYESFVLHPDESVRTLMYRLGANASRLRETTGPKCQMV
jgi:hypothetical protein